MQDYNPEKPKNAVTPTSAATITVAKESLNVSKNKIITGRLKLTKEVKTRDEVVDVQLSDEAIEVQHVPINRFISERPSVREDGDVTIIPLVEEVLVVEKKLRLREEVHIRKVKTTKTERRNVVLKHEDVRVTRSQKEQRNGN